MPPGGGLDLNEIIFWQIQGRPGNLLWPLPYKCMNLHCKFQMRVSQQGSGNRFAEVFDILKGFGFSRFRNF